MEPTELEGYHMLIQPLKRITDILPLSHRNDQNKPLSFLRFLKYIYISEKSYLVLLCFRKFPAEFRAASQNLCSSQEKQTLSALKNILYNNYKASIL